MTRAMITLVTNPITMVIIIVVQSLLICLILFMNMSVSWYSYILFLIFIGGLIVLFIYICRIASNEIFSRGTRNIKLMLLITIVILLSIFSPRIEINILNVGKVWIIYKIIESINIILIVLAIFFLLFTLIVVVKISNLKLGPIRAFKK
jgi:NADH-ubiquinone oxidoreductase chain 6